MSTKSFPVRPPVGSLGTLVVLAACCVLLIGCGSGSSPVPAAAYTPAGPTATRIAVEATNVLQLASTAPTQPLATDTPRPPTATPALPSATDTPTPPAATNTPKLPTTCSTLSLVQAALGDTWTRPADGMTMIYVPGGKFQMGSAGDDPQAVPDELPSHPVTLDSFWMDQIEVNNAQFVQFLNERGSGGAQWARMIALDQGYTQISQAGDRFVTTETARDRPVVMVTWHGAAAYCQWAGGRLPTEAEWEYAARGPVGHLYPWGHAPPTCDLANHGTCVGVPQQARSRPAGASWCGALDLAGNVWEWVADWFAPYSDQPQSNPTGPASGDVPVLRGGGWHSPPWELRATYRQHELRANGYNGCVGFRCVVTHLP